MNSSLASTAESVEQNVIRSRQVTPLPVGPGGNNPIKRQLNDTNIKLTMLTAQAGADTKYDPPIPKHITEAVTIEKFCGGAAPPMLAVIGGLCIVYGLVAK